MTDHFAALAQPRRPWLDAEVLRESFQRAAAHQHPDTPGGGDARFAALNAAHSTLREPATRLRHLLNLTAPDRPATPAPIPPALAELFMALAGHRRALDSFRQKDAATTSPLVRALLAGEKARLRRDLEAVLAQLQAAHDLALGELRALDAVWTADPAATTEDLATLQARFAFLGKWTAQLRESLFQLSA